MNTFIIERRFTVLEEHASKLRHGQECHVVLDEVIAGGQHVVVKLPFEDGVIWVVRISFPACPKDTLQTSCVGGFCNYQREMLHMESEIATLQYVAEMTDIPAPRVFGYNLHHDNGVGGPYMLMEMVHGKSLQEHIESRGGISHVEVQRVLDQMSDYVAQLSNLRFKGIGRLRFGESSSSPRLDPIDESDHSEPYETAAHYFADQLAQRLPPRDANEAATLLVPTVWTKAEFSEKVKIATLIYQRAVQFLGSSFSSGPFPLQHVDLNQQNIIVDEHCNVRGIVDWENAMTSPFETYDIQLMRIFKLWWQEWKGLEWVEDYAYRSFMTHEKVLEPQAKLSAIYCSRNGGLGRILEKPYFGSQFVEQVGNLVEFLYRVFEHGAEEVVPREVATEIMEVPE